MRGPPLSPWDCCWGGVLAGDVLTYISPLSLPHDSRSITVYVDAPKATDTYSGIRLSTAVGEQNYIKGNPKFFSVSLAVRVGGSGGL